MKVFFQSIVRKDGPLWAAFAWKLSNHRSGSTTFRPSQTVWTSEPKSDSRSTKSIRKICSSFFRMIPLLFQLSFGSVLFLFEIFFKGHKWMKMNFFSRNGVDCFFLWIPIMVNGFLNGRELIRSCDLSKQVILKKVKMS